MVINDKRMIQSDYVDRLEKLSIEQTSTLGIKALPIGKVLYDTLENLFFLEHEVKHLFVTKPIFSQYTEADEIYRKIINIQLPDEESWEKLNDLQ